MSTGVIIALIVVGIVVVAAAAVFAARTASHGGHGLKRRFGPEYDRAVARHDGDTKAAEQELAERVKLHGSLQERPIEPAARERYLTRWADAQERFVESPADAVVEADRILADLAKERGFPDGAGYDEQFAALSVHHGPHVHGYRRVHHAANSRPGSAEESHAGTEELRTAMVEARALFDVLLGTERTPHRTATPDATPGDTAPHQQSRGGLKGRLAKGN